MKRIFLVLCCLLAFVACKKDKEPTKKQNTESETIESETIVSYSVGDIVLSDGSVVSSKSTTLSDAQKQSAVAYIFYVGEDLNNEGETSTRTLGIGFKTARMAWCTEDAQAYDVHVDDIDYLILNGSQNLSKVSDFLVRTGRTDDTDDSSKYPAFYFAKNYKNSVTQLQGTEFEEGWYLPSRSELLVVLDQINTIRQVSALCGGDSFESNEWFSASQASMPSEPESDRRGAWVCAPDGFGWEYGLFSKKGEHDVCVIREF